MNALTLASPCKVNLCLNILGRREDGFHELESLMLPVPISDELRMERGEAGVRLSCSDPHLPVDGSNLVYQAARVFFGAVVTGEGITIHMQKNLPLAAGIGAGSANAAYALRGLNELWGRPLSDNSLRNLASGIGSDVPFFLADGPAIVTGRGEKIRVLEPMASLSNLGLLMVNPGFGVSTPWAYRQFASHLNMNKSKKGMADSLADELARGSLENAKGLFFNSLEKPVFEKHAVLPVIRDFLESNGALVAMMSGSGATVFALTSGRPEAEALRAKYHGRFGQAGWSRTVLL
ncbi:MAG: 4-(cytidine 5'-diphospho)-2-C-methyl-D-erythritol kinase [Verrucomicrobiales bacterium]|nr:4-(cytidine 5'-diphospho)-2-C-methyl-D-erythritol kinase [Verrucomicrobiales bacterium]|tara:strand:- start:1522 stop:2397 length:876 start_codon:yes stop_codon:yes gene_type:complete